jgi:ADP-ribosylglycohydrolase
MPTEFLTPEQIATEFGRVECLASPPTWHPHAKLPPGSITDDTGQALALAAVYLRHGHMTAERAAQALLEWAENNRGSLNLFIGPSTRRALEALQGGASPRESGKQGTTNGAAMRVAPIGIVRTGDLAATLADTVEACVPTHNTTLAISGAAAVSFAVAAAMRDDASLASVLEAAMEGAVRGRQYGAWVWTPPLEKRIALAVRLVREAENERRALQALYDYVGVDMLVSESIPTALGLAVLAEGDPMRAVRYGANIGGDTDTIGAIAGAVCGAWQGIGAVDRSLLEKIEQVNGLNLEKVARGLVEIEVEECGGTHGD